MGEHDYEELTKINAKLKDKFLQHMHNPGDYQTDIDSMILLRRELTSNSEKTFERPLAAFVIQ